MESADGHQRLFVAICVPDDVKSQLSRVQSELKSVLPPKSTSWSKPDNMHLTLRFLGNVQNGQIPELVQRLDSSLTGFGAIDLVCERLGCFPDLRFPRVVWAWVHDDADRLIRLHGLVNEAVAGFAEKPAEKRFDGHITLARPKNIKRHDAERLAAFVRDATQRRFGNWNCTAVELIRSELDPAGSRYTTLKTVKL
ncbi:MAG TPA: RNA 2',3'-cyclic phosphodiesterase [Verrucomicrobiota bacterium]|nr:RNA 2',3'-cyclic phosphodiesterase [Verrucomicrobiota bacterium]